jgi:hypothetical protein
MSKQSDNRIIRQETGNQSQPIELNEQQLDLIAGGTTIRETMKNDMMKALIQNYRVSCSPCQTRSAIRRTARRRPG